MTEEERAVKLADLRAGRAGETVGRPEPEDQEGGRLPGCRKRAFDCPHCQVFAHQDWYSTSALRQGVKGFERGPDPAGLSVAFCRQCFKYSLWVKEQLVYPATSSAPTPVHDMPEDVKADYLEARDVYEKSPRSAGGLLRLGFEKLLKHVGATKTNPNDAIGELVQKGLALGTQQQAMDIMRVFANQSVHNGFVKLEDQRATVGFLFNLLNYIVEQMITRPKHIQSMFSGLPPDKLAGIEKRDGNK